MKYIDSRMKKKKVLIIESDLNLSQQLSIPFHKEGFYTKQVNTIEQAIEFIENTAIDVVVLDLTLPAISSVNLYKKFSYFFTNPIIITSAMTDEESRISGLELGADDYICKPYNTFEVVARVKAILNRYNMKNKTILNNDKLIIKQDRFQALFNNCTLDLTTTEFKLLKKISSEPNLIFTREHLINIIYENNRTITARSIDSHIKNLRRKLKSAGGGGGIKSVYGVGYVWRGRRCYLE